ncbi:MAG: hypothetical protein ABFQ62_02655 [Patescibacteria group bacterium]
MTVTKCRIPVYAMGKVKDFQKGTELALKTIDEGLAFNKLEDLIIELGDNSLFNEWQRKAGLD